MALTDAQTRDLLSGIEGFGDMKASDQDYLVNLAKNDKDARAEILSKLPDYDTMSEADKKDLSAMFDTPEIVGTNRPQEAFNSNWSKPLDMAWDAAAAGVANELAGMAQLSSDLVGAWREQYHPEKLITQASPQGIITQASQSGQAPLSIKLDNDDELMRGVINRLREFSQNQMKEYAALGKDMGGTERFLVDAASNVLETVPPMLASIYTGTAIPAIAAGVAKGFFSTYNKDREAGYSPTTSGLRASLSGTTAGLTAGLATKQAMNLGMPFLKRLAKGAMIDAVGGGVGGAADVTADWLMDTYHNAYKKKLLPDSIKTFEDGLSFIAYNTATNIVGGLVTNAMPEIPVRAKLWARGLRAIDIDGKVAVVNKDHADVVEPMLRNIAEQAPDSFDPQETVKSLGKVADSLNQHRAAISNIVKEQKAKPLSAIMDFQPAAKSIDQKQPLTEGQVVGISAEHFKGQTSEVINETTPGKVVAWRKLGKKARKKTGSRYEADIQIDTTDGPFVVKGVLKKHLTEPPKDPFIRSKYSPESPQLAEFVRNILTPDVPFEDMTGDEARRALGGFFRTVEELHKGALGAVGSYKKGNKKPYGAIVWDAMKNNPDQAYRIMTHEIGHVLTDMSPEAAKKFGLEGMQNFRQFVLGAEDITNLPPDIQPKVKQELNDMWDAWSLYKDDAPKFKLGSDNELHAGNVGELMANAMSMFLNAPADIDYKNTHLYGKFTDFIKSNEKVYNAYNLMKAQVATPKGSALRSVREMLAVGDQAEIALNKLKEQGKRQDPLEYAATALWNEFYPYLRAMDFDPMAVDKVDSHTLSNGKHVEYMRQATEPAMKLFKEHRIEPADFKAYVTANRVLKNRELVVKFLKNPEKFDSMDEYQQFKAVAAETLRKKITEDNPEMSAKEVDNRVRTEIKELDADNTYKQTVDLRNPGNLNKERAEQTLADINNKYTEMGVPNALELLEDARKAERVAFNEWILPTLEESQLYTPDQIDYMRENSNYAFFDIIMHKYYSSEKRAGAGSVNGFYRQKGTDAIIPDPFAATIKNSVRMAGAVEKASMLRDMLSNVADAGTARAAEYANRVVKDADGDYPEVRPGYQLVKTRRYDPKQGKMVEEAYIAKNELVDTLTTNMKKNLVLKVMDPPNRYLKTWMTVYNPGFWAVNFLRDNMRNAFNLPGWKAMIEVPLGSVKEIISIDTKLKRQMNHENLLLGGISQETDSQEASFDRMMASLGEDMHNLKKTWGDVKNFTDAVKHTIAGAKDAANWVKGAADIRSFADAKARLKSGGKEAISWLKGGALAIGERTEDASKISAYKYLMRNYGDTMSPEEIRWYVRNAAGTPMLTKKGTWNPGLSSIFLFYNPNIQGVIGDLQTIKRQGIEGLWNGALIKRLVTFGVYQAFIGGILQGVLGKDMQDMLERIPFSSWMRYINIPVGITDDGKTAHFSLPLDPTSQWLNTLAFATVTKIRNHDYTFTDAVQTQIQAMAKDVPSETPLLTVGSDIGEFLTTGNITDSYYNQKVIPENIQHSNDYMDKAKYILQHFYRTGFAGPLGAVHRIPFSTETIAAQGKAKKYVLNSLQDASKYPFLSNTLGRYLRFSDGGIRNWSDYKYSAERRAIRSQKNAAIRAVTQSFTDPNKTLSKEQITQILQESGTSKYIIKRLSALRGAKTKDPRLQAYVKIILNEGNPKIKKKMMLNLQKLINELNIK